jgi:hypothetical protein
MATNLANPMMRPSPLLTTADTLSTIAAQRASLDQKVSTFVEHLNLAQDKKYDLLTKTPDVVLLKEEATSIFNMLSTLHPSIDPTEHLDDETDLFASISYLSRAEDYVQTSDTRALLVSLRDLRYRLLDIKRKVSSERKTRALAGLASMSGTVKMCYARLGSRTLNQSDLEQIAAAMRPVSQHAYELRYILSPEDKQKLGWDQEVMQLLVARLEKLPREMRGLPVLREFEWQMKMLERML